MPRTKPFAPLGSLRRGVLIAVLVWSSAESTAQRLILKPAYSEGCRACAEEPSACLLNAELLQPAEALALLTQDERRREGPYSPYDLVARIGASGAFIEPLTRYAEGLTRRSNAEIAYHTLHAVRQLGAPRSFFLWRALDVARRPVLAGAAVEVLAEEPDSTEYAHLQGLLDLPHPSGFGLRSYGPVLEYARMYEATRSPDAKVRFLLRILPLGGPAEAWARARLRQLHDEHPAAVRGVIDGPTEGWGVAYGIAPIDDCPPQTGLASWRLYLRAILEAPPVVVPVRFPAPIAPGVSLDADVAPLLECVVDGDTLTALFGYENRTGVPVRIPHGERNRLDVPVAAGRLPEDFDVPAVVEGQPGRTPPFPGHVFRVTFGLSDRVTWTLGDYEVTASAASPRCPGASR